MSASSRWPVVYLLATALALVSLLPSPTATTQVEELWIVDPTEAINALTFAGGHLEVFVYDPAGSLSSGSVRGYLLCPSRGSALKYEMGLVERWRERDRTVLRFRVPEGVAVGERFIVCGLVLETQRGVLSRDRCVSVFKDVPDSLLLMHISDAHLVTPLTPLGTSYHHLLSAFFLADALGVDLVVNTGDTSDHPGSVDELTYYVRALRYLRRPIMTVPGNHDGAGIPPQLYQRVYGRIVGSPHWYRRFGPYLLVGIDTTLGYADVSQLNFVEEVLRANADAEVKIVLMHYPIFRGGFRGSIAPKDAPRHYYSSWANVPSLAERLLVLASSYNVTLVLAGHIHNDGYAVYDGRTVFLTTVTLGGSRSYYNGYRLVRVYRNGSVSVYLPMDRSLKDEVNSLNVEAVYYRLVEFGSGTAAFIKVLKEAAALLPERFPVYLVGSKCDSHTVYLIEPLAGVAEAVMEYDVRIATWGGGEVAIARVDVELGRAYAGVIVALSCAGTESSPPVITGYRVFPARPRPAIDRVLVEVAVRDDTAVVGGTARVVWYDQELRPVSSAELELVPADPEHEGLSLLIPPAQAGHAEVTLLVFDAFGNVASEVIRVEYVRPVPATTAPAPTTAPTATVTAPSTAPLTPPAPATTPTPTPTPTPTAPSETPTRSPLTAPTTATVTAPDVKPDPWTMLAIIVGATVLAALVISLLYKKRK